MHVAVSDSLAGFGVAAAVGAPAAAVGDRWEFLDVDVHQLAGFVSLVSQRFGGGWAGGWAGAAVAAVEAAQSRSDADAVHRGWVHGELLGDEPAAAAAAAAQLDHLLALRLGGAPQAVTGSARSVPHARFALVAVAVDPFACCLVVALKPLRGSRRALAVSGDEAGHLEARCWGEGRVGVLGPSSV